MKIIIRKKKYLFILCLIIIPFTASFAQESGFSLYYRCLDATVDNFVIDYTSFFNYQVKGTELEIRGCDVEPVHIGSLVTAMTTSDTLAFKLALLQERKKMIPPERTCAFFTSDTCFFFEKYYGGPITLPILDESIFIVTWGCCRRGDFINVYNVDTIIGQPNLLRGIINYIEITPEQQKTCNNVSPIFDTTTFSEVFYCVDELLELNFPTTDAEGDNFIYSFCAPYTFRSWGPQPAPNPAPAPPYLNAKYIGPEYTPSAPMGQGVLNIDQSTGRVWGYPTKAGAYLVGLCVDEYRNGKLLGSAIRDLTIIVDNCAAEAEAILDAPLQADGHYYLQACLTDSNTLRINNLSETEEFISEFYWKMGIEIFTDWNPTFEFNQSGRYTATLFLNPGQECTDTAFLIMDITTDIEADFVFSYDTCVAGPVQFNSQSYSDAGSLEELIWDFGDGQNSDASDPSHLYQSPDAYSVSLHIIDENACQDSITKTINWQPVPPLLLVAPSQYRGCAPIEIFFDNLSNPIDSNYQVFWTFGDGGTSESISPSHTFWETGVYNISLSVTSPIGCSIDTVFSEWIKIENYPEATFSFDPTELIFPNTIINFENTSPQSVFQDWSFDVHEISSLKHPSYAFRDTGLYEVVLIIQDQFGCTDTTKTLLEVRPRVTYFLPNAFTPNGDGNNDVFVGKSTGSEFLSDFHLQIVNRYGEQLFATSNPNTGWDGYHPKSQRLLQQGVYYCQVSYQTPYGNKVQQTQPVVLLK